MSLCLYQSSIFVFQWAVCMCVSKCSLLQWIKASDVWYVCVITSVSDTAIYQAHFNGQFEKLQKK